MNNLNRITRIIFVIIVTIGIGIPVFVYFMLSLPFVQDRIRDAAETELSKLVALPVNIKSVGIAPFNRLVIRGVTMTDSARTDTIARIRKMDAGIKISSLFGRGGLTIEYASLVGAEFRLKRDSIGMPLNAQPMFDALKGDGKKKSGSFRLAVNTVVLRKSVFSYDVASIPQTPGVFNQNHILVSDLKADISLRELDIPPGRIDLKAQRIALKEKCGFAVNDLHFRFRSGDSAVSLFGLSVELPESKIEFDDIVFNGISVSDIGKKFSEIPLELEIKKDSYVTPSDFSSLLPVLSTVRQKLPLYAVLSGRPDKKVDILLEISEPGKPLMVDLDFSANHPLDKDSMSIEIRKFKAQVFTMPFSETSRSLGVTDKIFSFPEYNIAASGDISRTDGRLRFSVDSPEGLAVEGKVSYSGILPKSVRIKSELDISELDLTDIIPGFGTVRAKIEGEAGFAGGLKEGKIILGEGSVRYRDYDYESVTAMFGIKDGDFVGEATVYDPNARVHLTGKGKIERNNPELSATALVSGLNLRETNLLKDDRFRNYDLSFEADGRYAGKNPDLADAALNVRSLSFRSTEPGEQSVRMNSLSAVMAGSSDLPYINLRSDFIDVDIIGKYSFGSLVPAVRRIAGMPLRSLVPHKENVSEIRSRGNDFSLNMTLKYDEQLVRFLKLPVSVIYPVEIKGYLSEYRNSIGLDIDAPYLLQKNKIIENTTFSVGIDSVHHALNLNLHTSVPTKYGLNNIMLDAVGENDRIDTDLSWLIDRKKLYKGEISLSTAFSRGEENPEQLSAVIDINPSMAAFNDSVWTIDPAKIYLRKDNYTVDGLNIYRANQYITAAGTVSRNPEDILELSVLNFNLDYLFESLGLDNVRLGGDATGVFHASGLLDNQPRLLTDDLKVKNISFNKTVFGNAVITSKWDNEKKGIMLDATIAPQDADSLETYISGGIFPMSDSLDLHFDADRIDASFLLPYMEAFATSVSGRASGKARIYGNFKYINMTGDILAEDFKVGIAITNTSYTVRRDSIHITPGRIPLDSVTIYDDYGNTGLLNGSVTHKFFKDAGFSIDVTDIDRLLCYNTTPEMNSVWNGRIFGDGTLHLRGVPGTINVDADVRTAPNSSFNLTLSDEEEAGEYSFISFNDVTSEEIRQKNTAETDSVPDIIKYIKKRMNAVNPSTSSNYNVNLQVDITPDAAITLIMDPDTQDKIRAKGEGNMRLVYTNEGITAPDGHSDTTEDMKIYGSYTVTKGNYYFTLQDIIVKDFVIKPGSTISFTGNPDAASLNLTAYYPVQANLTDLDESFAYDSDLNRTNVPVHALLNITGDIRQPEIGFDMEFPTLNSDIDRKVRSIVSTDEMMDMQIIYLLALNRFYTPEYMSATSKSNEFVSVASSTLSSRLSNILGSLSDNWTVAPNVRSDKGDFSDVEVDLALSSSLLNNRLLFNGNLGYRDNTLNTNRFVGDFDLEYLLNPAGNIRLKAYNRYNDQNFYFKTATTTQGVGIMYKIDFDKLFNFKSRKVRALPADKKKKKIIIR